MGADQMRDMDAGDPLLAQCLRDRAGLGMTELGEPRPGERSVQRPGDIVRGLTMTDEKKTHGPDRTGRSCAFYGPEVNVPCRSARGQYLEAVPEAIAGVEAQIPREGRALGPRQLEAAALDPLGHRLQLRERVDHQRRMRSAGRTEWLIDADVDLRDHRIAVEGAEPATAAAGQILGLVHLCEAHGVAVEAARQLLLAAGHRHLHVMQSHGGSLVVGWSE